MARYRRYAPSLRSTVEYRGLSGPAPNAQSLVDFFIVGPLTTIVPGLLVAGPATVFEALGWDDADPQLLRKVWEEVIASGLVRYDKATRLVWLPALTQEVYLPDQPQVLQSWAAPWSELPDSELKHEAWVALRDAFAQRRPKNREKREVASTAFADAFLRACPEPRCSRASEAHIQPENHPNTKSAQKTEAQHAKQPDAHPNVSTSHAPSRSGSLQDQDQDQKQDQEQRDTATRVRAIPLTGAEVYRRLALLWCPAKDVLHVQWTPCKPPPHQDLPGTLEPASERYWFDAMRQLQPTDEALTKAAAYLAARQHWQDKNRTGVSLAFLLKPNSGNLFDLLSKARAWAPEGERVGASPKGLVKPSAAADQNTSTEELRALWQGVGDGR